jgi:hypothetical protein
MALDPQILVDINILITRAEKYDSDFQAKVDEIFDEFERARIDLRSYMYRGHVRAAEKEKAKKEIDDAPASEPGKIRVGRILKKGTSKNKFAVTNEFKNIIVTSHNKSKLGATLSPYVLEDSHGRIMENIWQFAKIYVQVSTRRQKNWKRDPEVHVLHFKRLGRLDFSKITTEYWKWRHDGMTHRLPVRYPNGFEDKEKCICCLWPTSNKLEDIDDEYTEMEQLDYITARKRVYAPIYIELAKQTEEFEELKAMVARGENIQILDVDGPDETIYEKKAPQPYNKMAKGIHGVTSEVGSIAITRENIRAVLNDPTQPFGHGYCLAVALMGKEEWLKE